MTNVLIRDVPDDVLSVLKDAAARDGQSLQTSLLGELQRLAVHKRRQATLALLEAESRDRSFGLSEGNRSIALDALDADLAGDSPDDSRARR